MFRVRTITWFDATVVPLAASGAHTVLAVSHGAFIATLLRTLFETERFVPADGVDVDRTRIYNCSVTVLEVRADGGGVVERFGDISHLLTPVTRTNADVAEDGEENALGAL